MVESEPPHEVCVYRLDPDALALAHREPARLRSRYAECMRTGEWPGFDPCRDDDRAAALGAGEPRTDGSDDPPPIGAEPIG